MLILLKFWLRPLRHTDYDFVFTEYVYHNRGFRIKFSRLLSLRSPRRSNRWRDWTELTWSRTSLQYPCARCSIKLTSPAVKSGRSWDVKINGIIGQARRGKSGWCLGIASFGPYLDLDVDLKPVCRQYQKLVLSSIFFLALTSGDFPSTLHATQFHFAANSQLWFGID